MMNNADGLTCYAESVDFSGRFFEQHRIVTVLFYCLPCLTTSK